jgi:hypothetical protein
MPNRRPDDELLAAALARVKDCPPVEELERLIDGQATARLKQHVDGCPHCQTELQMLRSFTSNQVAKDEEAAVASIAARLKARSSEIAPQRSGVEEREPWWKRILAARWLTPAAAALAVALVVVGGALELRQGKRPSLDTATGGAETLRSSAIAILSPVGDLRGKPTEIRWEAVQGAARYRVRVIGVDRAELWRAEITTSRIELPANAETLIVPGKTLFIQVAAFDSAGSKIAESEVVRFRLLQNVYIP